MKETIGVVGLGIMGMAVAKNAKKAGFDVVVTNRSVEKRREAESFRLSVADTPRLVAERSAAVVVFVTDPAAVRAVLTGPTGVFAASVKGKTLIQMSTIDEKSTHEFERLAKEKGMLFLDCPVTGSKKQVEAAQLILLAGGDAALIERWTPFFQAISKAVVHAGGVGKGTALKLCMNLVVAQMTTALCESTALARAQELDPAKIFEVIRHSPALNCGYYAIKEQALLKDDFTPAFSLDNMLKDVRFMDATAKVQHLNLPVTEAVKHLMESAAAAGFGAEDLASVVKILKPAVSAN